MKGGYYLVRPEVLALHLAAAGDPQFYTGCAQIFLESSGDAEPTETVSIPGYVDVQEPGLSYNIYVSPPEEYPIPGPELAEFASGSNYAQQTEQTEGLKPEGCILENDNWCAMEVDDYSTEQECWDVRSQTPSKSQSGLIYSFANHLSYLVRRRLLRSSRHLLEDRTAIREQRLSSLFGREVPSNQQWMQQRAIQRSSKQGCQYHSDEEVSQSPRALWHGIQWISGPVSVFCRVKLKLSHHLRRILGYSLVIYELDTGLLQQHQLVY